MFFLAPIQYTILNVISMCFETYFIFVQEMLKDKVRTLGYKHAIMDNPQLFKDKVKLIIHLSKKLACQLKNPK